MTLPFEMIFFQPQKRLHFNHRSMKKGMCAPDFNAVLVTVKSLLIYIASFIHRENYLRLHCINNKKSN